MKASELKDKSVEELKELHTQTSKDLFQSRLSNYTNQLDDTSSIPKGRKDVARIKTEMRRRELEELAKSVQAALTSASTESK